METINYNIEAAEKCFTQGLFGEALGHYEKALSQHICFYGDENFTAADIYKSVSNMYLMLCNNEMALENINKATQITISISGESSKETSESYNKTAQIYFTMDNFGKSLEYFKKSLNIYFQIFGEESVQTAGNYTGIARVYNALKKYDKELQYNYKSLRINVKLNGEDNLDTATNYQNVADSFCSLNRYKESIEYYDKAMEIRCRLFSEKCRTDSCSFTEKFNIRLNSYLKLKITISKAGILSRTGNYEQAESLLKNAIPELIKITGDNTITIAEVFEYLGDNYSRQNDTINAKVNYRKALTIFTNLKETEIRKVDILRSKIRNPASAVFIFGAGTSCN
ncbi:MAG: tetratricopeptide repeat protein [Ignavibacteriae bacterium]|nr:tetratricopeptide repeat protein [Ignavibacteriota bacterium]